MRSFVMFGLWLLITLVYGVVNTALCRRSVGLCVGASVCPVHCAKTANRIRMTFGIIGQTGPRMRQIVGFGDPSTGRGTFGGEFGARHCNQWGLTFAATRPSFQITLGRLVLLLIINISLDYSET